MRKKVNNHDKLAIQEGIVKQKSVSQLSEQLNLAEESINSYLDDLAESLNKIKNLPVSTQETAVEQESVPQVQQTKPAKLTSRDIILSKRDSGGSVAIMSKAASERVDSSIGTESHLTNESWQKRVGNCLKPARSEDEQKQE